MSSVRDISDLLLRWRELKEQGQACSAEELCADCPELVEELKRRLQAVEFMEAHFGMRQDSQAFATLPAVESVPAVRPTGTGSVAHSEHPTALEHLVIPGYELLGMLDQGGMGVVYKARQVQLKRLVALKMILAGIHARPQQLTRFRIEAEAVAKLQHPHIVQIYEVGESEGRPFFSMEYVEGGSLARQIAGQPQPPAAAAQLVETLARTMHYAHQRGIVHRDLKPANILLQTDKETSKQGNKETSDQPFSLVPLSPCLPVSLSPKITDFGLAKLLNMDTGVSDPGCRTQSGVIMGTPSYMAPEQAEGKSRDVGPHADIYALGAILYEMLTGRPPFEGVTPLDTLLRVLSQDPEPPSRVLPKVPRDLETICLKCLEKKPSRRYATAEALADDLHRFRTGLPIVARSITLAGRTMKWARRRPEIATLTLLLVVTAVGLVAAIGTRYRAQEESRQAAERSAPKVRQILHRYCFHCHGQDPNKTEGDLNILNYDVLLSPDRKLVVKGDWKESRLIHRIEDGSMPPENEEEFPRLASEELEVLKGWVMGGVPPFPDAALDELPEPAPSELSVQVKKIFLMNCHECHRFGNAKQGIKILNHDLLVNKRMVVVPGQPEQSALYQLMISSDPKKVMPPLQFAMMSQKDIETVRSWIAEGAPPFPRMHVKKSSANENPIKQP